LRPSCMLTITKYVLFFRNVTPFSLVGMYGLYGETWTLRDTFLYALTEGGRFFPIFGTCIHGRTATATQFGTRIHGRRATATQFGTCIHCRTATQNTYLILPLLSGNIKTFTSECVSRSAISLRS
jgi:hypothetical protein